MKKIKYFVLFFFLLIQLFFLTSCQSEFTITFKNNGGVYHEPLKLKRGAYLKREIERRNLKFKYADDTKYLAYLQVSTEAVKGVLELDDNYRVYNDLNVSPFLVSKKETSTVHYDTLGGDKILPSICANNYRSVEKSEIPTKKGYVFTNWEYNGKEFDYTQSFFKDKDGKVINHITLTARWVKKRNTVKVKFDLSKIYKIKDPIYKEQNLVVTTVWRNKSRNPEKEQLFYDYFYIEKNGKWKLDYPSAELLYHKFLGFEADGKIIDFKTHIFKKDTILRPVFEVFPRYKINLDTNGGEELSSYYLYKGQSLHDIKVYSLPKPKKQGAKFVKWVDKDGKVVDNLQRKAVEDTTYYAVWTDENNLLVHFKGTNLSDIIVKKGDKIPKPELTEKVNQVFFGWLKDGKFFDLDTPILEDTTIEPLYKDFADVFDLKEVSYEGKRGIGITGYKLNNIYTYLKIPERFNGIDVIALLGDGFYGYTKLEKIDFPKTMKFFNSIRVFEKTKWLERNFLTGVLAINGYLVAVDSNIKFLDLTKEEFGEITNISPNAFINHPNLEEVVIPEKIEKLNERLFYGCLKLKKVKLPKSLVEIKDEVFKNCESLEVIELYDLEYLNRIGNGAFENCTNLKTVTMPPNKKVEFGYDLFNNTKIEKFDSNGLFIFGKTLLRVSEDVEIINIPDNVEVINTKIFTSNPVNPKLRDVRFSPKTYKICDYAFYGAKKLGNIDENNPSADPDNPSIFVIPNTVREIGRFIFEKCDYIIERGKEKRTTIVKINYKYKERPSSINYNWNKLENKNYNFKYIWVQWYDPVSGVVETVA